MEQEEREMGDGDRNPINENGEQEVVQVRTVRVSMSMHHPGRRRCPHSAQAWLLWPPAPDPAVELAPAPAVGLAPAAVVKLVPAPVLKVAPERSGFFKMGRFSVGFIISDGILLFSGFFGGILLRISTGVGHVLGVGGADGFLQAVYFFRGE